MEYLDFVLSEVHGLRTKELRDAKASCKKVVGAFCVFVPEEIVLAAGGVQVGLCAGAEIGKGEAEKVLPRNTCALIKSFCQPYSMEAFKAGKALSRAGIPMLAIETDYSMQDVEQLETRLEAFVEMTR